MEKTEELINNYITNTKYLDELKGEYPALNTFITSQLTKSDDSKNFVDRPSKRPFSLIEKDFEYFSLNNGINLPTKTLKGNDLQLFYNEIKELDNMGEDINQETKNFIDKNFYEPGTDLKLFIPIDYIENQLIIKKLHNPTIIKMFNNLNKMMKDLSRIQSEKQGSESTLINLKHPFFIPGGRFREFYYWDSYWILKGLLVLDMPISAENILKNFTEIINKYGHFPNGTRTYYINRSQPPYYPLMLHLMYQFDYLKDYILTDGLHAALTEYEYFMKNITIDEELNYYNTISNFPRPESFSEDFLKYNGDLKIFTEIKSVAESGWDFSTRWVDENDKTIITQLLPADLNSILYTNEMIISFLFNEKGEINKKNEFIKRAEKRKKLINKFLWNPETQTFADYNFISKKHRSGFYASNLFPIIHNLADKSIVYKVLLNDFENIFGFPGGIPASDKYSGEQWDFPNVWAPYLESLENYLFNIGEPILSKHIANTFFNNALLAFKEKGVFYEKYTAENPGTTGEGGEYIPQEGFGWTNGTLLNFIKRYGDGLMHFKFEESKEKCYKILKNKNKSI